VELSNVIRDNLDNPNVRFVFPSELTARFWAKSALRTSARKSIRMTRFLSWDQFKESCLTYAHPGRPVNRAVRLLFLHRQLERNSRTPHLREIIPPRYGQEPLVFLQPLERILPVLHRISGMRSRWPSFSRDRLRDLEDLYTTYRTFLSDCRLYEPNYLQPRFVPDGRTHLIFFPELIEDYSQFAELLKDRVALISLPPTMREHTTVRVFETLPEEIRSTVQRMADLVDGGSDPNDMVLTVGELRSLEPHLRREAELLALPLQIHLGKPLSEFPQVTMLYKAFSAAQSAFSLHTMKALLLCRSIPWKQERLCGALIRLALDGRIAGNTAFTDYWALSIETARRNGNPRKLPLSRASGFYSALKKQLVQIAGAGTFAELKKHLISFTARFLDLGHSSEEEIRIYQFALDTLDELDLASELASEPRRAESPDRPAFPIWWLYLHQRLYVPGRYSPGIPVYPFRVSGGMNPEQHLVMNASQAATSHTVRLYPFLKLHEEQNLPEAQAELSAAHLQLYSHSGKNVLFSYSRRDLKRTNLPPPAFLTHRISAAEAVVPDAPPAYELEQRAWIDGTPFPLHPIQQAGYRSAAIGALAARKTDCTEQRLGDRKLVRSLAEHLTDEKGRVRISATALERFSLCAFRFLFEQLLEIENEEYEPTMIDSRELGSLLHRVLERFFNRSALHRAKEPGDPPAERLEQHRSVLAELVLKITSDYQRNNPSVLAPIAAEIRRRVEELTLSYLDIELPRMADERVQACEMRLEAWMENTGTLLVGQIDRVDRNPGGYTLIDYKKKTVPRAADLFSEPPRSIQMPFYIYLMEQNDLPVNRAAFYSLENKRYHFVIGGPRTDMAGPEDIRRSIEGVTGGIRTMRQRIAAGDFRIGVSSTPDCSRCSLKGICRHEYTLDG
jgi:RecB family exonuclease